MDALRILIAEDETIIRLDLKELLEAAGHEVCAEARDGEEAVALAREHEPDIAILDVKMPRLDGIAAARLILEHRSIPIVMLTAFDQDKLVARAAEAGAYAYLVKPFREQDLLPALAIAHARHDDVLRSRRGRIELDLPAADGTDWPITIERGADGDVQVRLRDEGGAVRRPED
jgi:response regulator NasT